MKPQWKTQSKRQYWSLAIASPLVIFLLWLLVSKAGWVRPILLPTPGEVALSFTDMLKNGYSGVSLYAHLLASLSRVGTAFVIGSLLGTTVGMLRGRINNVDAVFLIPCEMLRPIPPLGLIPLFIYGSVSVNCPRYCLFLSLFF